MIRSVTIALLLLAAALTLTVRKLSNPPSYQYLPEPPQESSTRRSQIPAGNIRSSNSLEHYRAVLKLPFPPGVHGMVHLEKNRRLRDAISKLSPGALTEIMREDQISLWENPESFARWGYYFLKRYGELHPDESLKWVEEHFQNHYRYCHYLLTGIALTNPDQAMDLLLKLRTRFPSLILNDRGLENFGPSFQDIFESLSVRNRPRALTLLQSPDLQSLRGYTEEAYASTLPGNTNWEDEIERLGALPGNRDNWPTYLLMRWAMFDPAAALAWKEQTFSPYQSDSEKVSRFSRVLERAAKEKPEFLLTYLESTPIGWPHREGIIEMLSRDTVYSGHDFPALAVNVETKQRINTYWVDLIRHSPPHTVPNHVFERIRALGHLSADDRRTLDRLEEFPAKTQ